MQLHIVQTCLGHNALSQPPETTTSAYVKNLNEMLINSSNTWKSFVWGISGWFNNWHSANVICHLNQKRKSISKDEKKTFWQKFSICSRLKFSKSENGDFLNLKNIYRKLTDWMLFPTQNPEHTRSTYLHVWHWQSVQRQERQKDG